MRAVRPAAIEDELREEGQRRHMADVVAAERVLGPQERWHRVGDAGEPAFQNGWVHGAQPARFMRDNDGFVRLRGSIDPAAAIDGTAFTLPASYRPPYRFERPLMPEEPTWTGSIDLWILTDGRVVWTTGSPPVRLDGIVFRVA